MIKATEIGKHLDPDRMVAYLLDEPWHKDCTIIPNHVGLHAEEGARPKLIVCFEFDDQKVFLRHSLGPRQGFGWDCYGDDFQKMELALIALSQAPMPQRASMTFKLPLDPVEEPTTEEIARAVATRVQPTPAHPFELGMREPDDDDPEDDWPDPPPTCSEDL